MSELMNKLPTSILSNSNNNNELDYSNDRQIFDLINHLNDLNNRDESINFKTESDNTSEPIEEDYDYDYDETNVNNYSEVSKQQSSTSQIPKPSRIPQQQLFMSNSSKSSHSSSNQLITKIPRITPVRQSTNLNNIPLDLTSSSLSSISQPDHEPEIIKPKLTESKLRTPRCYQRNSSATPSSSNNEKQQRGQSQSAVPTSKQSSNRSLSITDSNYSLIDNNNNNNGGKKNVRYILKHKPRETKVKIFSQKVEIKNVHSKIGSLEKAATYTPGGGNVVIETRALNWNAQAKIGSLEKAATYTPGGGNVKIESQKLNWSAQAKIGSLEKANYTPGGGNVKIESKKLNFKENARPKTDTGLILIETNSPNSYLSQSQSVSTEQIIF